MSRSHAQQKAALTRALKKGHAEVLAEVKRVKLEWEAQGYWPDDWTAWQRALDDTTPWPAYAPRIEDV